MKRMKEMKDSKNIISKVRSIGKLFYLNSILLILVFLFPYAASFIYPEIPRIELLVISAILFTLVMIFYCIILTALSSVIKGINSPAVSLAEKMMKCKLRIENGLDYCAKCPDGYTCASK